MMMSQHGKRTTDKMHVGVYVCGVWVVAVMGLLSVGQIVLSTKIDVLQRLSMMRRFRSILIDLVPNGQMAE